MNSIDFISKEFGIYFSSKEGCLIRTYYLRFLISSIDKANRL